MTTDPRLAVSIVNWRTSNLVIECLRSVAVEIAGLPVCRVFVVDNHSQDGSASAIRQAIDENGWQDWATLLEAHDNLGFAGGNNLAIRHALAEEPGTNYVLLLNPDTLVRPGAFRILIDFLEANPKVGIAGGRSEDPDETPQFCCFRFPGLLNEFALYLRLGFFDRLIGTRLSRIGIPKTPTPVDWVSGALMMIRRDVIEAIGLLDEGYFLYFEETDFTLRARRAGWTCWHVPQSRIVHLVGQSSGVTVREGPRRRVPAYWFESRRRYFVLNHGVLYTALVDLSVVLAYCSWRVRRVIQRRPDPDPPRFLRDFMSHSVLLTGRSRIGPRLTRA